MYNTHNNIALIMYIIFTYSSHYISNFYLPRSCKGELYKCCYTQTHFLHPFALCSAVSLQHEANSVKQAAILNYIERHFQTKIQILDVYDPSIILSTFIILTRLDYCYIYTTSYTLMYMVAMTTSTIIMTPNTSSQSSIRYHQRM